MTLPVIKACVLLAICSVSPVDGRKLRSHRLSDIVNKIDKDHASLKIATSEGYSKKLQGGSVQQPAGTRHETWLDRMGNALYGFIFGIFLILFSVPIMWMNERRQARMESLVAIGESEYVSVKDPKEDHRGELVHAAGGEAHGLDPVECAKFGGVSFPSGCLMLRTQTEVYQWEEIKNEKTEKDNVGGGQTTTTTYEYKQTWSTSKHDSSKFNQSGYSNVFHVEPGIEREVNNTVRYQHIKASKAFEVPTALVQQLGNFNSLHDELPDTVSSKGAWIGTTVTKKDEWFVYEYAGSGGEPTIGDLRVSFDAIKDGAATIMALQTEGSAEDSETFLPYRIVSRGYPCIGLSEKELKRSLLEEAVKSGEELAEEDECNCGPLAICCCVCVMICGLVNRVFAAAPPQIYHMFDGEMTAGQCMSIIKRQSLHITWILRGVSWAMMFIGTCLLFGPVLLIPELIPFIGGMIARFASVIIGVIAFILTMFIAVLIMSAAYLVYRPLVGLCYLIVAALIIAVPIAIEKGLIPVGL